jgi:hypothetical protein
MEIVKSRYGLDRVIEKIGNDTMRVMGESAFVRKSTNKENKLTMFDFEGGPCLTVGGKITFGNLNWKILEIEDSKTQHIGLEWCKLKVSPIY